jgi:DNA invertase Pin-like site-specific DNA recombinase
MKKSCFECQSLKDLAEHHVVPVSLGGTKTVQLCPKCHGKVHDMRRISHARLTKDALAKKKENGERTGAIPYGYNLAPDNKTLVFNYEEQVIVDDILEMRKSGMSFPKIAKALTDKGIPTKNKKKIWNQASIRGIIIRNG